MKPEFQTDRFDVFKATCERNKSLGEPRDVYIAFHRQLDICKPMCVVTIMPSTVIGNYVEWVHVDDDYRREKVATEILREIELRIGTLIMEGVTEPGEAFVADYCDDVPLEDL